MTANRIIIHGELRPRGRTVEIIVKPGWRNEDLAFAASLQGEPVRITIESAAASQPEPLTGGPADIGVRVRIKSFFAGVPGIAGQAGTLIRYDHADRAEVRLDSGWTCVIPSAYVERAPAECPHCGASRVAR